MTTTNNILSTSVKKTKQIVLLGMFLLTSSISMFGQNVDANKEVLISSLNVNTPTSVNVSENNNMNLYSWFMGTKQMPYANIKNEESGSIKKQMINSGIEPNRLLLKSFLKKATNYTEVVA